MLLVFTRNTPCHHLVLTTYGYGNDGGGTRQGWLSVRVWRTFDTCDASVRALRWRLKSHTSDTNTRCKCFRLVLNGFRQNYITIQMLILVLLRAIMTDTYLRREQHNRTNEPIDKNKLKYNENIHTRDAWECVRSALKRVAYMFTFIYMHTQAAVCVH